MTTVIRGTDSSASAPALTGADSDTGVYFPAANQVALATNGTQAVIVDSSQNVGIGVSSPGAKLHVKLPASGDGVIFRHTGSTLNPGLFFFVDESTSVSTIRASGSSFGVLAFDTSNTERGRFDSSGNLLVGTTSQPVATYRQVVSYSGGSAQGGIMFNDGDSGVTYEACYFRKDGSQRGYIRVTTSGTTYNTVSDYRLKENVAPMTGALAKIAALNPCTYTWKDSGVSTQGFIAHELAEVVPECVSGEKDEVDAEGNPKYQGIDTSFLVATLTAAIQELKAINDAQAETITALTARVTALEQPQP